MCKSKIQFGKCTQKNLRYSGSITIDKKIMDRADISPYEMVLVVNLNSGARFETYVIPGRSGSGIIGLNGGAARLGELGDELIIISYCFMEKPAFRFKPGIVRLASRNSLK